MMSQLWPKSIHQIFADNLRKQCSRFESIAALCRACNINRQQFNRYLSGQNLPNPRTLKRLCEVLQLPETALFAAPSLTTPPPSEVLNVRDPGASISLVQNHGIVGTLSRMVGARATSSLKSGFYHCYTPLPGYPRFSMRILISVNNSGTGATFCRRTAYSKPGSQDGQTFIGKHRGNILSDVNGCLFLGINTIHPFEFSILKLAHAMSDRPTFIPGLALLRLPDNDMACNIAMHWVGDKLTQAKAAMRRIGIIPVDDPSIDREIAQSMTRANDIKQPMLLLVQDTVSSFIADALTSRACRDRISVAPSAVITLISAIATFACKGLNQRNTFAGGANSTP